jgi:hypothetical protein
LTLINLRRRLPRNLGKTDLLNDDDLAEFVKLP